MSKPSFQRKTLIATSQVPFSEVVKLFYYFSLVSSLSNFFCELVSDGILSQHEGVFEAIMII